MINTISKSENDKLIQLILNMTKAEKRQFKLFISRSRHSAESKFIKLFDHIEKLNSLDERKLIRQSPDIKLSQLSNLKAQLFKQLLTSLRLNERNKSDEISMREQIDFAKIMYDKGMYKACLDMLARAKEKAYETNYESIALSILYFEKRIESQHVSKSMTYKAETLSNQSDALLDEILLTNSLSNAALLIYGKYLENGYVRSREEFETLQAYFNTVIPKVPFESLKFFQKVYFLQAHVWYYNIIQDFVNYYKFAQRWVNMFYANPAQWDNATILYLKGIHNLLNALFMAGKRDFFNRAFQKFLDADILAKKDISLNEVSNYKLIVSIHTLNKVFINADYFSESDDLRRIESYMKDNKYGWDLHRYLILNYKLACVYFGRGALDDASKFLNNIINSNYPKFREDIQSFARILDLIVHFDLNHAAILPYKIKSLFRYLKNLKELQSTQREIIKFLKRIPQMTPDKVKQEFVVLRTNLVKYRTVDFEKRPFLYLDIISWLESKIQNIPIREIIKSKVDLAITNEVRN